MQLLPALVVCASALACANQDSQPTQSPPTAASTPGDDGAQTTSAHAPDDLTAATDEFIARLDKELELSDEQERKVKSIYAEHVRQVKPHLQYIRSQPDRGSKIKAARERRPQLEAIRDATDAKMKEVLSATQYTKYEVLREEFKKRMRDRMRKQMRS